MVTELEWIKMAQLAVSSILVKSLLLKLSSHLQYASQEKIECRKLGGRLEYLRSTLDRFKDQQIRPAHCWVSRRSIIPTALGSGK
jgi:hypothetical protein